jgi:glycosyltransferase involved in cell wall biosynthesis
VCIPCLDEKGYIETTLENLAGQTLFKKGKVHIILAEYKDQLNLDDDYLSKYVEKMEHVTYLPVFQKGIAVARNAAITNAKSNVIVNFDADCIFDRTDAIEKMIHPILNQEAMLTNCETKYFDFTTFKPVEIGTNIYDIASRVVSPLERFIIARGPGLTVSKAAFWSVGGFRDTSVGEDYLLGIDICMRYSIHVKKFIDEVKVFASNRRAKNSTIDKDHLKVFDYSNKYR